MDSVIKTMKWFYHETCGNVEPGVITVLHPFGGDLGFKLYVHALVTKGGFDKKGKFIEWSRYVPQEMTKQQKEISQIFEILMPKIVGI